MLFFGEVQGLWFRVYGLGFRVSGVRGLKGRRPQPGASLYGFWCGS